MGDPSNGTEVLKWMGWYPFTDYVKYFAQVLTNFSQSSAKNTKNESFVIF